MTDTTPADRPADQLRAAAEPAPFRYVDEDGFCLSSRLLPDLDTGGTTGVVSITIEGSDEPQSAHVPVAELPKVLAGIAGSAALAVARQLLGTTVAEPESGCAHCGSPDHAWDDCAAYTAAVAEEAADLATQLYKAQDALAFVGECCNIADRAQRPITTGDVREWLKGARCGRQLLGASAAPPAPADRAAILNEQGPGERETLGEAADAYRWLRTVVEDTMTEPDRWDGDEAEVFHLGRYVQWLAAHAAGNHELCDHEADEAPVSTPLAARCEALAAEWEKRGEYGDSSITDRARELRAVLAARVQPARRRLTPQEYDRSWHAVEGSAGEPGADPGTILHAVLHALRIDAPTPAEAQAASPSRRNTSPAAPAAPEEPQ
ncbi:hypothetical protein ACWDF9_08560 [Streptomyces rubiginosohelvolus]